MMGVHDVGVRQDSQQARGEGLRRVTTQPAKSRQGAAPQTTRLMLESRLATKGDEFSVDVAGQGASQLEWIALTATK
jgi:hypothetical protein